MVLTIYSALISLPTHSTMKESETFTPPSSQVQQTGNIEFNAASRGTSGPVHSTYPGL